MVPSVGAVSPDFDWGVTVQVIAHSAAVVVAHSLISQGHVHVATSAHGSVLVVARVVLGHGPGVVAAGVTVPVVLGHWHGIMLGHGAVSAHCNGAVAAEVAMPALWGHRYRGVTAKVVMHVVSPGRRVGQLAVAAKTHLLLVVVQRAAREDASGTPGVHVEVKLDVLRWTDHNSAASELLETIEVLQAVDPNLGLDILL